MKLSQALGAVVLMASAAAAHAEVSSTITATTDYDWRGITQTANGPALQASLDYASDMGLYVGAWASNVDFGGGDPNIELDLYAGWGGGEEFPWDVGIVWYTYPGETSFNFPEVYGSLGWKWFTAKVSYSWDFAGTSENAMYYEGNIEYELPANFGFTGHVGYSDGNGVEAAYGQKDYTDWSVGFTYSWSHFDFALKWVDGSDMKTLNNTSHDISSSDARAIFSVSTTIPWKAEGE